MTTASRGCGVTRGAADDATGAPLGAEVAAAAAPSRSEPPVTPPVPPVRVRRGAPFASSDSTLWASDGTLCPVLGAAGRTLSPEQRVQPAAPFESCSSSRYRLDMPLW